MLENIERILTRIQVSKLVEKSIHFVDDYMAFGSEKIDITNFKNIHLIGIGKSSESFIDYLFSNLKQYELNISRPVIFTKHFHAKNNSSYDYFEGGHPEMDSASFLNGRELLRRIRSFNEDDLLLLSISGGASAIIESSNEFFSDEYVLHVCCELLSSGGTIEEVNSLRAEVSEIKNGGVVAHLNSKTVISFILCDVPSGDISFVGSGPTVFRDRKVLDLKNLSKKLLSSNLSSQFNDFLESRKREQYLKSKKEKYLAHDVFALMLGDHNFLKNVCIDVFKNYGSLSFFDSFFNCSMEEGVGAHLSKLSECIEKSKRGMLISFGELNVKVKGRGKGGRNTEFVAQLGKEVFSKVKLNTTEKIIICSFGTDGTDGPTDAAGAWLDKNKYKEALENLNIENFLFDNNTYSFFEKIGALVKTGPTGTNLMDIRFIYWELD